MTNTPKVPTAAADSKVKATKLEDLMVAMDVVDTLRHDQAVVARELDTDGRRERLLVRLRDMYKAQGIEVPDHVLQEGIRALEDERFKYTPVAESWRTRLARIWVSRRRWSKPIGFLGVLGSLFSGYYFVSDVLPEQQLRSELPDRIVVATNAVIALAKDPSVVEQATERKNYADSLLASGQYEQAQTVAKELEEVQKTLGQFYTIRVVAKPNEPSGVWRIPPNQQLGQDARNYYLIVEAVDDRQQVVELHVLNEEDNTSKRVTQWGLRVSQDTFFAVAADKQDDGVIQANKVGIKERGYLKPQFSIPTPGGTITQW